MKWLLTLLVLLGGVDAQSTRGRVYEDAYVVQSLMAAFNAPPVTWPDRPCAPVRNLKGNEGAQFAQFLIPQRPDQVSARLFALFAKLRHGPLRTVVTDFQREDDWWTYTVQYGPAAGQSVLMYLFSPARRQGSAALCVRRARYVTTGTGFNR